MKKSLVAIMIAMALSGCWKQMSIEDVNKAVAYCKANNMSSEFLYDNRTNRVYDVYCKDTKGFTYGTDGR